jgi:hypothetical protein
VLHKANVQPFAGSSGHIARRDLLCSIMGEAFPDGSHTFQNALNVDVDGKNVVAEATHHDAKRRLRAYTR